MPTPSITGVAPLVVQFTDTSEHNPTHWAWDFGNGQTSSLQTPPPVTYQLGTYSVSLAVSNNDGQSTLSQANYITVTDYPITNWSSVYSNRGYFEGAVFDSARSVIAIGSENGESNYLNVVKWHRDGTLLWQKQIGTSSVNNKLYGECLVVDNADNIYGFATDGNVDNNRPITIFKLTPTGHVIWQKGLVPQSVNSGTVVIGNVIVVNDRIIFSWFDGESALGITELDTAGNLVQSTRIALPISTSAHSDQPRVVDANNNELIISYSVSSNNQLIAKLDSNRQVVWNNIITSTEISGYGLSVAPTGSIYITSYSGLIKLNVDGTLAATMQFSDGTSRGLPLICIVQQGNFLYVNSYRGHIIRLDTTTDVISYSYKISVPSIIDAWYRQSTGNALAVNTTNLMYCGYTDSYDGIVVVMPLNLDSYTGLKTTENGCKIFPTSITSSPITSPTTISANNTLVSTDVGTTLESTFWAVDRAVNTLTTGNFIEIGAEIPEHPMWVSVTPLTSSEVNVDFTPPFSDGGRVITSYTVTSVPGNIVTIGTASPIIVAGLSGGTSYTFTVHATNVIGNSIESDVVSATTLMLGDPYFANVSLLLHGDGAVTDSSNNAKIVTATGGVAASTTESVFGGSSLYFDGINDNLLIASNVDFNFGTGDFTIEAWYKPGGAKQSLTILRRDMFSVGSGAWGVGVYDDGTNKGLYWFDELQGGVGIRATGSSSSANWAHYAVCRVGGVLNIFIDGVSYYSGANTRDYSNIFNINIGNWDQSNTNYSSGYLDDLRITTGVARYTNNFAVPSAPFLDQ